MFWPGSFSRMPSAKTGFSAARPGERRVGANALVVLQRDGLSETAPVALSATFITLGSGTISASNRPAACAAAVRDCDWRRVFVLPLARDLVARRDDLGGLEHRHVEVVTVVDEPRVLRAIAVHLVVLHERDRLEPAADGDAHAVGDDLLGGDRDRHQTRGALPVDRHAGDAGRKAGAQRALAGDVAAGRALLQRRAHHDVVDLGAVDMGAVQRLGDGMSAERLGMGVVERAAIGLADRRAGG